MARAADTAPSPGVQRGRGGFMRDSRDVPYIANNRGDLVKSGARKGLLVWDRYSSTSNFGTLIENRGSLEKFSERKVVEGLALLNFDLDGLALLIDGYDEQQRNSYLDGVIVEAKRAADAWLAADRGTLVHNLTEHLDRGEPKLHLLDRGVELGLSAEVLDAFADAWSDALTRHGLQVLAVEQSCVDDLWRCAGTLDRIVRTTRELRFTMATGEVVVIPAGTVLVLDIKTGSLRRTAAIQIASYAQSVPYDTEAETRGEWEWEISQQHALIAHLDMQAALDGDARCELVYVDLVAGREHGGACVAMAKQWEQRTDVFSVAQLVQSSSAGVDLPPASAEDPSTAAAVAVTTGSGAPVSDPVVAQSPLREAYEERKRIDAEADQRRRAAERPAPTEGDAVSVGFDELQAHYVALNAEGRAWIAALTEQSMAAGVSFHSKGTRTARRFEIIRGLVLLAEGDAYDDDVLRALLELTIGDVAQFPAVPPGQLVGSLSAGEAAQFAEHCSLFVGGDYMLIEQLDGTTSIRPVAA